MRQQPFGDFSAAVLRFPKLLVAAVNGPAVGVGVTLLPHCDLVYAFGGAAEGGGLKPGAIPRASSSSVSPGGAGDRQRRGAASSLAGGAGVGTGVGVGAASFWTPFFRLAIVPEFCSSVTFPEILVGEVFTCSLFVCLFVCLCCGDGGWVCVSQRPARLLGEVVPSRTLLAFWPCSVFSLV